MACSSSLLTTATAAISSKALSFRPPPTSNTTSLPGNSWVAKYRREKDLLGRPSFRDMYSALNAVSGHYISFGPTVPIPTKRKAMILEEIDTAEKALQ